MRRRHVPAVLCSLALALSCNAELDTGLGQGNGDGGGGACECTAPQTCSKAGPTCIEPGTCAGDLDCDAGKMCAAGVDGKKTCVIGGKCGGQAAAAEAIPPNMLIVLDRSCSMRDNVAGKTKWEIAVAALKTLTTNYKDKIRFGMTLFPDKEGEGCAQGTIPIPVGAAKESAIQSLLTMALDTKDALYPSGPCVTNIDTAMDQARSEKAFSDLNRQGFALLVTDGQQSSCNIAGGDNGTVSIINDLRMKKAVRTFVIGFGSGVDAKALNSFAMAGGTTSFYKAEDQASLEKALATIAASTLGCDFQLKQTPPNGQQIYVFFDKMTRVNRDAAHKSGWDYNEAQNRVTFYGMACDSLRAGTVKAVDIVFGCDAPPPG